MEWDELYEIFNCFVLYDLNFSRKTGFTAEPRILEYFDLISFVFLFNVSGKLGILYPCACNSAIASFN
jgi:hypothetical protein